MYADPTGLRKTCKAPGVATTFKLFGKALVDKLPFVSSDFSQCQARQGGAIAGVYEEDVVPVANLVAERSLGSSVLRSYQKLLPDGSQVWAEVRNGAEITNGGLNSVPR